MSVQSLTQALTSIFNGNPAQNLTRLSGGASRDTWRFDVDCDAFVIQIQRSGDIRTMATEIATVIAAHAGGVPVAELVASSELAPHLVDEVGGAFMVFRAVEGETIARKILRDEQFLQARPLLVGQCANALARLHSIAPDTVPALTNIDQLQLYRDTFDTFGEAHPAFELVFRWLEEHQPEPSIPTIVHGDFRLGNLIVGPAGLQAVLDWELAHLGDPLEDLGWLCVRAWRFGAGPAVAGVGSYSDLISAYSDAIGHHVSEDAVRWWEVLGTLKWGVICMMQAHAHLSGVARSHELAAIGRRVCETEYDLFLALEHRW